MQSRIPMYLFMDTYTTMELYWISQYLSLHMDTCLMVYLHIPLIYVLLWQTSLNMETRKPPYLFPNMDTPCTYCTIMESMETSQMYLSLNIDTYNLELFPNMKSSRTPPKKFLFIETSVEDWRRGDLGNLLQTLIYLQTTQVI